MRVRSFLVVLALLGGVLLPGPAAHAGDEVHCTSVHDATLSPGLSINPSSGSVSVPTGTMECHGPINGRTPTGIGGYREEARYGTEDPDTCQDGGEGEGIFTSHVPTADGDQELSAPFTITYGDLTTNPGFVSGEFRGNGVRGTIKAQPLEGDCVTKPVTRVRITADFFFAESFFTR